MNQLLAPFDRTLFRPIFQQTPMEPFLALEFISRIVEQFDEVMMEHFGRIPHSISAIFYYQDQIRIDTISSDEKNPYNKD